MFSKAYKKFSSNAPKTETQVSPNSQSEENANGNNRPSILLTSNHNNNNHAGQSRNHQPVRQLPPYVYVPSTNEEASSPVSQGTARKNKEANQQHSRSDTEGPQELFPRRQIAALSQMMIPTQHPLFHIPSNEERLLQHFHQQPQYIVVSPANFAAHSSAFLRPYDFPVVNTNNTNWQQVRFHAPPEWNIPKASRGDKAIVVDEEEEEDKVALKQKEPVPTESVPSSSSTSIVVGEKPKRPLSAYNYFFKEEREKMILIETGECGKSKRGKKKRHGIKFEDMAKSIAKKWNEIGPEALEKFEEMARSDKERYKIAMQDYNRRKNSALAAVHKELASTVSKEKMQRYLKNQNQRGVDNDHKSAEK